MQVCITSRCYHMPQNAGKTEVKTATLEVSRGCVHTNSLGIVSLQHGTGTLARFFTLFIPVTGLSQMMHHSCSDVSCPRRTSDSAHAP